MTLSEAGRLLRKKRISVSRQLLAAGQIWKNSLPKLIVEVRHHRHTNVYGFYLTTSFENLLKGAEEERLRGNL
ncbi:anoctamin [Caerostris extrusa]|uniref:Anoctamin n=1 Tax=Caerostris extrusa TaxID=172846 RepID=A0AAV4S1E6_CAEEX|nr:anoctamin [Caerostris extrusa]